MEPRIVELEPRRFVGKKMKMSLLKDRSTELWRSFMPEKKTIQNVIGEGVYSVNDYPYGMSFETFEAHLEFEKWACVEVTEEVSVPQSMEELRLRGGTYAVFIHRGDVEAFRKLMGHIFKTWVPSSRFRVDDRPHYEYLDHRYKGVHDPSSEEEVWIPLVKK